MFLELTEVNIMNTCKSPELPGFFIRTYKPETMVYPCESKEEINLDNPVFSKRIYPMLDKFPKPVDGFYSLCSFPDIDNRYIMVEMPDKDTDQEPVNLKDKNSFLIML